MQEKELNEHNECYYCKYMYRIPGDAHIGCKKFCGGNKFNAHGIRCGWVVIMPMLDLCNFDPIWKETMCPNFEEKQIKH